MSSRKRPTPSYNPSNIFALAHLVKMRYVTEYSLIKTEEYPRILPNFQTFACCEIYLKGNKHNSIYLTFKVCSDLSLDIICSSKLTVFLELCSRKTVLFSKAIIFADKYPSIFWRQMEAILYVLLPVQRCLHFITSLKIKTGERNFIC